MIVLLALIIGFLIDLMIGDPHSMLHPVCLMGRLITLLEKVFRKLFPKSKGGELAAGGVLSLIVISVSGIIPYLLILAAGQIHVGVKLAVEAIMCWQILATKSLKAESMKVYYSLQKGDVEEARFNVSMIVGRDTLVLDDIGITKAAVETVAENTSDGVIAPMLYLAIGGPVLGFMYKSINTMDSMIGYKDERYLYLGRTAARLDDVVNFIPARVSALLMIAASLFGSFHTKQAIKIFKRDRYKHASPNSAQTESVCAGALGVQLAGDAYYHGILHKKQFIGDALKPISYEDIKRANHLMLLSACICFALCVIGRGLIVLS